MSQLHIRWMIQKDLHEVSRIDSASYLDPWGADQYRHVLRHRNCIGLVAECKCGETWRVVSAVVYEMLDDRLNVLRFAVHPSQRRRGAGTAMLHKLSLKLSYQRRQSFVVPVLESSVEAQCFLRQYGCQMVEIVRGTEDVYVFEHRLPPRAAAAQFNSRITTLAGE